MSLVKVMIIDGIYIDVDYAGDMFSFWPEEVEVYETYPEALKEHLPAAWRMYLKEEYSEYTTGNSDRLAWLISLYQWRCIIECISKFDILIHDDGKNTCGLCMRFHCGLIKHEYYANKLCPVELYSGVVDSGCKTTPYANFVKAKSTDQALYYAREERNYIFKVYKWWKNQ